MAMELPIYEGAELISFPSLAVWVVMNYPDDHVSAARAISLLTEENLSINEGSQDGYSHLGQMVLQDVSSGAMMGKLSGCVALQVYRNILEGGEPNINKALYLVHEWGSVHKTAHGKRTVPSSRIRKEFPRYRSVCHLWAAFELLAEGEQMAVLDGGEALENLLLAAAKIEELFVEQNAFSEFHPWSIPAQYLDQFSGTQVSINLPPQSDWIESKLGEYSAGKIR